MNSIEIASKLNEWILQQPVVKEFQEVEKKLLLNTKLQELDNTIKGMQKVIVNKRANNHDDVEKTIKEYKELKAYYDNHPMIVNYLYLKEEVDVLLQQINTQINNQLM